MRGLLGDVPGVKSSRKIAIFYFDHYYPFCEMRHII